MFKYKIDGVIEAVHYAPDGKIAWVRVYERRGPTYSDRVLLDRETLLARLKAKKLFVIGRRLPHVASTFDVSLPVRVIREQDTEVVVTGYLHSPHDRLEGAPII